MAHKAWICLGSNTGDARGYLERALLELGKLAEVRVVRTSPVYRTEPQGYKAQPWFVNQVAELACGALWTPESLLSGMLGIESRMGRVRSDLPELRFGPRCIDLDLLLFDEEISADPLCTLPHPRMHERAFVLIPLRDVAPGRSISAGKTAPELLARLSYSLDGDVILQNQE